MTTLFPDWDAHHPTKKAAKTAPPPENMTPSARAQIVLNALRAEGPMDDTEIHALAVGKVDKGQVEKLTAELAKAGLIRDTGRRGAWRKGRTSIVWEATQR
jgi:hypothetical protein